MAPLRKEEFILGGQTPSTGIWECGRRAGKRACPELSLGCGCPCAFRVQSPGLRPQSEETESANPVIEF